MCVVDNGEEGEGRVGILAELDLLPVIQACRVEGEQIVCPYSLLLLGHLRAWAHLQDGDGDELLGQLTLVAGKEMVSHLAQVVALLVVRLVVAPPQGHGLLVGLGGGGHPHIVCPPTLRSS